MLTLNELNVTPELLILPNGIKIVNFKRENAPVSIKCLFAAGSRFDDIEGTAHFLEHLLVAGTKRFPTKDKLAAYIESYGGSFNANTGIETLAINISIGDPKDISIASKILQEMIFNSPFNFNNRIIETERKSILRELDERKLNPSKMIRDVYRRLFFQNTLLGRSTLGTENSIKSITKSNLINFYKKYILSGQVVLVTSGDISIETINKYFSSYLSDIKYSTKLSNKLIDINFNQRLLIEKYKINDQLYLAYGFRTGSIFNKNNSALKIIDQLLGGSRSSVLMQRLRYERGLIYEINTWFDQLSDSGSWVIQTLTSKKHLQEVINIIKEELTQIIKIGLDEDKLSFAKNKIIKSGRLYLQTSEAWVNLHAYRQLNNSNKIWTLEDYIKELEFVDGESIKKTAKVYLKPNKSFLVLCGDIAENEVQL